MCCSTLFSGEVDDGVRRTELVDCLPTGSAGLAGDVVEVDDGDGPDADLRPVERDGRGDGILFGANRKSIGGVFYVAA